MNKLVIDLETQNSFQDVGGRGNLRQLKISVAGLYWYPEDKFYVLEEKEFDQLEAILKQTDLVIGFNTKGFDWPIMESHFKHLDLNRQKHLDIMEELERHLGYRVNLESVAVGTLGVGKTADGMEAIRLWQRQELAKLKDYCRHDVQITKDVYEHGLKNKEIKFKAGWQAYSVPVNWDN